MLQIVNKLTCTVKFAVTRSKILRVRIDHSRSVSQSRDGLRGKRIFCIRDQRLKKGLVECPRYILFECGVLLNVF